MKPRFCAICRRCDDKNIARCLVCGQYFCNNASAGEASHILEHVRQGMHVAFDFQQLGVPFCSVCGKKNICSLFQSADGLLFCSKHNTGCTEPIVQDDKVVLHVFSKTPSSVVGTAQQHDGVDEKENVVKTGQNNVFQQQLFSRLSERNASAQSLQDKIQASLNIETLNGTPMRLFNKPTSGTIAQESRTPTVNYKITNAVGENIQQTAYIRNSNGDLAYQDVMSAALLSEFKARGKQQQKFQKLLPNSIIKFNVINGARFRVRLDRKTLQQMGIDLELYAPVAIIATYLRKTACLNGTVAAIYNEDVAIDLVAPVGKCYVGPVIKFTDHTQVIKQFKAAEGVPLVYQQEGMAVCLAHKGASYALTWTVKNAQLDAQLRAIQLVAENTENIKNYALILGQTVGQVPFNDSWSLSQGRPDLAADIIKDASILLMKKQGNSEREACSSLNEGQFSAIAYALQHEFTLISGCPGSGKSYIAGLIAFAFSRQHYGKHILCCASSQAAAQNLTAKIEALGVGVVRFHQKNSNNPVNWSSGTVNSVCSLHSLIRNKIESRQYVDILLDETINSQLLDYVRQGESKVGNTILAMYTQLEQYELSNNQIIVATCLDVLDKQLQQIDFAAVIIDDANAIIEPECLLPIIKAPNHVVLLGDEKQLFPSIVNQEARNAGLGNSLFCRLLTTGQQVLKLKQQYRMQASLLQFCSDKFYAGGIVSTVDNYGFLKRRQGYSSPLYGLLSSTFPSFFWHVKSREPLAHNERRQVNYQEIEIVGHIVEALLRYYDLSAAQIGVITPYDMQRDALRLQLQSVDYTSQPQNLRQGFDYQEFWALQIQQDTFKALGLPDSQLKQTNFGAAQLDTRIPERHAGPCVMTVEEAQGCENDVIILSCVNSNERNSQGLAKSWQKLNVALTRQRCALIIVGDAEYFLLRDSTQSQLVQYYAAKQAIFTGKNFAMLHQLSLKAIQKAVTISSAVPGFQQACGEKATSVYQAQKQAAASVYSAKSTLISDLPQIKISWPRETSDQKDSQDFEESSEYYPLLDQPFTTSKAVGYAAPADIGALSSRVKFFRTGQNDCKVSLNLEGQQSQNGTEDKASRTGASFEELDA